MTFAIAYSPLTGHIRVGRLHKDGSRFIAHEGRTTEAALAVAEWVLNQHGGQVDLTPKDGAGKAYRITVEETQT